LRVYTIGWDYEATEIDAADAIRRFTAARRTDGANPVLAETIQTWLWPPRGVGGPGTLAESGRDVAALRTEAAALWRRAPEQREPDGRETR
jgi:hypothetical protein